MTAKFELLTQAYVDHLVKYHGSSLVVALEHVVGTYSVPVSSIKEYAADLRREEHRHGHVFLCPEVSRLLDIEGEGQYDGEVAGAWVRLLHSYASRYDKGIDQHGDTYWFVKNGDGDWFRLYDYLLQTLENLTARDEVFYIRDLSLSF